MKRLRRSGTPITLRSTLSAMRLSIAVSGHLENSSQQICSYLLVMCYSVWHFGWLFNFLNYFINDQYTNLRAWTETPRHCACFCQNIQIWLLELPKVSKRTLVQTMLSIFKTPEVCHRWLTFPFSSYAPCPRFTTLGRCPYVYIMPFHT